MEKTDDYSGLLFTPFPLGPNSIKTCMVAGCGSSIGCTSAWYADDRRFDPHVQQHSFMEIGHEIISTANLSLPLIQEGQLSVTGERMCTKN